MTFLIFATLALVILPLAYIQFCRRMMREVPKPPVITFFFAFGTLGGLAVLLALVPSPVGLMCCIPMFLSSMISFFCAVRLCLQKKESRYDAMAVGAAFLASIPFVVWLGFLSFGLFQRAVAF